MDNFAIFEDLHTLAHLISQWNRFYRKRGLSFQDFVNEKEPDRAYSLMLIYKFVQSLEAHDK